jgi:hypothetical protein
VLAPKPMATTSFARASQIWMSAVLLECLVCFMRAHEFMLVERWLVHEIQASSTGRALTLGVTETRSAKNRSPATCPWPI